MAERIHPDPARPSKFEDRYRLYLDESGDHVYRGTSEIAHRYLCLLGCWFRNPDYLRFHEALEDLKTRHLPHHPDEPVALHRDDMITARKAFKNLRAEAEKRRGFSSILTPHPDPLPQGEKEDAERAAASRHAAVSAGLRAILQTG